MGRGCEVLCAGLRSQAYFILPLAAVAAASSLFWLLDEFALPLLPLPFPEAEHMLFSLLYLLLCGYLAFRFVAGVQRSVPEVVVAKVQQDETAAAKAAAELLLQEEQEQAQLQAKRAGGGSSSSRSRGSRGGT